MASPGHDARKLKASGQATAVELKEFLEKIRGKNASEVLDVMAASGLVRGLVTATIGMAVVILVFTVVPYAWSQAFGDGEETASAPVAESQEEGSAEEGGEGAAPDVEGEVAGEGATETPTETTAPDPLADPAATAESLGIGDTKMAPSDVNPLENSNDDLLKDLE